MAQQAAMDLAKTKSEASCNVAFKNYNEYSDCLAKNFLPITAEKNMAVRNEPCTLLQTDIATLRFNGGDYRGTNANCGTDLNFYYNKAEDLVCGLSATATTIINHEKVVDLCNDACPLLQGPEWCGRATNGLCPATDAYQATGLPVQVSHCRALVAERMDQIYRDGTNVGLECHKCPNLSYY